MAKVLITSEYFGKFSPKARDLLVQAGLTVIDNPYGHAFLTPEQIIPHIGEADAVICDLEKITREVIDAAPNLKIIARRGVGVDSVDCAYAAEKGIEVSRTTGVLDNAVAELIMAYILQFTRRVADMNVQMHDGVWEKLLSASVERKTLGIIGMGHIGAVVAKRAAAFDMNIVYHDVVRNEAAEAMYGARYVSMDELLAESDFVSLHCALIDSTRGLMNLDLMRKMKPSAYLINIARGPVVNQPDLYQAVKSGMIAGAAIDVFDREPETESIFKELPQVILTPHIASFTYEIFIDMSVSAAQSVIRKLNA